MTQKEFKIRMIKELREDKILPRDFKSIYQMITRAAFVAFFRLSGVACAKMTKQIIKELS